MGERFHSQENFMLNTVGELKSRMSELPDDLPLVVALDSENQVFAQVRDTFFASGETGDLEITVDPHPDTKALVLELSEKAFL